MQELAILCESGFSGAEGRVYLALLELGPSRAGVLLKKTGLHKGTCYQVLQRLLEKGLISVVVVGKKQVFTAAAPERIADLLKSKEKQFAELLPTLQKKVGAQQQQSTTVYYGKNGIQTVLDALLADLKGGGEYVDFGASGLFRVVLPVYWEKWQQQKNKAGVRSKVIFDAGAQERSPGIFDAYQGEYRVVPKETASLTDTIVYGDKVILILWTAQPPVAIVITNAENAKSYRQQFNLMWRSARVVAKS